MNAIQDAIIENQQAIAKIPSNNVSITSADIMAALGYIPANPNVLSLGVHTDGLLYLFIDGTPFGTGIEMTAGNGDVVGYVDENNNIVVSGNLADGTYSVKYEMENGNTVEIGDLVLDSNVYYSITNTLTNCTNSSSAIQAIGGEGYSATISANSGYELSSVVVTMGGTDISASAVSGGNISITNVTGNIVVTAVATEIHVADSTNFCVPLGDGWISGGRCSSSGDNREDSEAFALTNYIAVQNGDEVHVKNLDISTTTYSGIYKSDKSNIKGFMMTASGGAGYVKNIDLSGEWERFTIDNANAGYVRICGQPSIVKNANGSNFEDKYDINAINIIVNIKRNGTWL